MDIHYIDKLHVFVPVFVSFTDLLSDNQHNKVNVIERISQRSLSLKFVFKTQVTFPWRVATATTGRQRREVNLITL